MAAIAAVGILAGIGALSGLFKNKSEQRLLRLQEHFLREKAQVTRDLGEFEIRQFNRQAKARIGAITAIAASSGVRTDSGSAYEVRLAQAREDATSRLAIKTMRNLQAYEAEASADQAALGRRLKAGQLPFDLIGGGLQGASVGMAFTGGSPWTSGAAAVPTRTIG